MSIQNHTPGPWQAIGLIVTSDASVNSIGKHICLCEAQAHSDEGPNNAALIARAPALLAENARLRETLRDIEANLTGEDYGKERRLDSLRRIKEALSTVERRDA